MTMWSKLNTYLLAHFFIGILFGGVDDTHQLTYAYWCGAVLYLFAKQYHLALRKLLYPRYRIYFYLHWAALSFALASIILSLTQVELPNRDCFLFAAAGLISFLIFYVSYFAALSFVTLLIRIPINARRRRAEAQKWREEKIRAERAHEERQRLIAERERQTHEAAARQISDQQRRIDARAACELFYDQHLAEVGNRFPREMFQSFMDKYMTDEQPVDAVERRATELRRVIQSHRDSIKPPPKFQNIQEITKWYLREKESLESLPIDEGTRAEQLIWLEQRYSELTQTMLEKIGS